MKLLAAFVISACLLSSPINALSYPRCQQSLAIVAFFTGGAGIGATLLIFGTNNDDSAKAIAGYCVLVVSVASSIFMICVAPYNWYGAE